MERRRFGSTTREVAVIGQGTWYLDKGDRGAAVAALRRGLDLGMTHIDTAEMYGDAEEVIAEAIAGRRDEVFLVSKVLPEHATRNGHHRGLRAVARAASGPTGWTATSCTGRGRASAGGHDRRLRAAPARRARSCPGA